MTRVDVCGVGIGPFNLGLAALVPDDVDAVLFDEKESFAWHHGLMLDDVEIQVPFLADLVSLVDPTNPHSFLAYLQAHDRLLRFYFHERMHVLRREFDAYYRWVASRLPSCRFGAEVTEVAADGDGWRVVASSEEVAAGAVVLGIGTVPVRPPFVPEDDAILHTADYVPARARVHAGARVTVIGSGQSAAEVVADVLTHAPGAHVSWFTRSAGFLPMEYSKLGLEHFSPEYTRHFHGLSPERRDALRAGQDLFYKGISAETSEKIYDALYARTVDGGSAGAQYAARSELVSVERAGDVLRLGLQHLDTGEAFEVETDVLVLGTGHAPAPPPVPGLVEFALLDECGRPVVEADWRIRRRDGRPSTLFVQNADLHSHGVGAPDLGLGAHRNAVIINAIAGREVYRLPDTTVFQSFGVPR